MVRVQLESTFLPRFSNNAPVSRTGGSTFLSFVRTNVHASIYEKVRWTVSTVHTAVPDQAAPVLMECS